MTTKQIAVLIGLKLLEVAGAIGIPLIFGFGLMYFADLGFPKGWYDFLSMWGLGVLVIIAVVSVFGMIYVSTQEGIPAWIKANKDWVKRNVK